MPSRIAKNPISIPKGVDVTLSGQSVSVKGSKGQLSWDVHQLVSVKMNEEQQLQCSPINAEQAANALAGTTRALLSNMVEGVSTGFERKLLLVGVGYRVQVQGSKLNLSLGFSHPVVFELPEGVTAEAPSQTELVLKGIDKQKVSQVAANIRRIRPPEPYKGKGVRYAEETVILKEGKKK